VYQLYYKAMFNTSLRIVQNSYEAEDVMQEAFLSAFTKLDSFKGEVAFGAWLKRIVINRSLTQLKKRSRLNETNLEVVDYKLEGDSAEEGMSELDLTHSKVQEVLHAMDKLKDNYRVILHLSLIEGYDNEEITKILQISNESCRTTISRAKARLRKILMETSTVN
jgi:RNA polymerase sigma-70 factor (ECF subfamily)